jgi:hypothetical protein
MEMSQNIVSIDGCHMKHSRYTGQLLLVTGRDGNMKNFTVAWALVLSENEDNYTFLFDAMKENDGMRGWMDRMQTVIISDRCKGLANAIRSCFKNATPVHCGRHLYMNVKALGGTPPKRGATAIDKLALSGSSSRRRQRSNTTLLWTSYASSTQVPQNVFFNPSVGRQVSL